MQNYISVTILIYLKFKNPQNLNSPNDKKAIFDGIIFSGIANLLSRIIPRSNPHFENLIESVKFWMVEFDEESGIPQREIGIDAEEKAIIKMPDEINYGYWTDNNLLLSDFKSQFDTVELKENEFLDFWNQ